MLLVLAVAVACSWFATEMQGAKKQSELVGAIRKSGGELWYFDDPKDPFISDDVPPNPEWLRHLVGDDFLGDAIGVQFLGDVTGVQLVSDETIDRLKELPQLESLTLGGQRIGDASVEHLEGLRRLEELRSLRQPSD